MRNKHKKSELRDFVISRCELEEILQKASQKGARMALSELGLNDEKAPTDIRDLRELIKAFRMAKKDSFKIFIKCILLGFMTLVTAGFISFLGNNIKIK
jgi:hypothetical protein